jgi:hypothetical protein
MEFEPGLYDVAVNEVAIALQADFPLMDPGTIWMTSTRAVERLVLEDLIIKPTVCEWRNASRTVDCENLAPLTKTHCYRHGNW